MRKQFEKVKQLTFSRQGKSDWQGEELKNADQRVDNLLQAVGIVEKRLGGSGSVGAASDPGVRSKRQKKCPYYLMAQAMKDAVDKNDRQDDLLKQVLLTCADIQYNLSDKLIDHEDDVEKNVSQNLKTIINSDGQTVKSMKGTLLKKHADMESAKVKHNNAQRHLESTKDFNKDNNKVNQLQSEFEDYETTFNETREKYAKEMFSLLTKETNIAHNILMYVKLQERYYEDAKQTLRELIPRMEAQISQYKTKAMYGRPLSEHLSLDGRDIAKPIEICVGAIIARGLREEGLFRITAGMSKVERMCLSLDAGCFPIPLSADYSDVHVIAGALKRYLSKLPEPLLTYELYNDFIEAASQPHEDQRLTAMFGVIKRLPKDNYNNLRYLIKFLVEFLKYEFETKMSIRNIAVVFAPNLIKSNDDNDLANLMHLTAPRNHVVEVLLQHADHFFPGDINFYLTFRREDLMPNRIDNDDTLGDSMTRSHYQMNTYYGEKKTHSRSNSHDTSRILMDNQTLGQSNIKRAQSNSSLSDQSSPPQEGSPKPVQRRKNKPPAPTVPPESAEKNDGRPPKSHFNHTPKQFKKTDNAVLYQVKHQSPVTNEGTQTKITISSDIQRKKSDSSNIDEGGFVNIVSHDLQQRIPVVLPKAVDTITAHHGTVDKVTITSDNLQQKNVVYCNNSNSNIDKAVNIPVAAPRTIITEKPSEYCEVELRRKSNSRDDGLDRPEKPAIPARPPTLLNRPLSFRHMGTKGEEVGTNNTMTLERTHVYNIDKQQPSVINVSEKENNERERERGLHRTQSIGSTERPNKLLMADNDQKSLSEGRKLSQSEGNMLDSPQDVVPLSPKGPLKPLIRPQGPAPPPPKDHKSRIDSVDNTRL